MFKLGEIIMESAVDKRARGKVANFLDKYEITSFGKNHKIIIFLSILMAAGMVFGTVAVSAVSMDFIYKIDFLFLNDFNARISSTHLEIFISSLLSLFVFSLVIEFFTLSFFGAVIIPVIVAFKGLGIGMTAGYLYMIYGLKGIVFYILILLPGIFISSVGIIIFAAESFKFSCKFAKKILPKSGNEPVWNEFKNYLHKIGCAFVILLISSLLDVGFMAMFSRFFEF